MSLIEQYTQEIESMKLDLERAKQKLKDYIEERRLYGSVKRGRIAKDDYDTQLEKAQYELKVEMYKAKIELVKNQIALRKEAIKEEKQKIKAQKK